ncbi:MAG: sporulation integral membrane protein YtvI [Halanaerobiales bacterium]
MEAWLKRILIFCLALIIILFFLRLSFYYLTPFVIAVLLAGFINPAVNTIEKHLGLDRPFAAFLVLSFFISLFLLLFILGVTQIYLELNKLLHNLPDYNSIASRLNWILQQNSRLEDFLNSMKMSPLIKESIHDNFQVLYQTLRESVIYIVNYILNILSKLPLILTVLILSCIATYFISRDRDIINDFIMSFFPPHFRSKIFKIEKELISSAIGFIRAELILILITGFVITVGLFLIGSDYALVLGLTAAVLDLVPVIGPGLLFLPWIIINIITGELLMALKLLVIFALTSVFRQGIEGKIIGFHLGLHPLATMMSFYIGYRLMGTAGFIIGPAALVLGKAIHNSGIFSGFIDFKE